MPERRLLVVLAVVAILLTNGTSGFTSTTADRAVNVSVVGDERALLGIERTTSGTANGTTNLTVTVTNRFAATRLDTVSISVNGESADVGTTGPLSPGAMESMTFTGVDCGSTVNVDVNGETIDVTLTRPVPCQ